MTRKRPWTPEARLDALRRTLERPVAWGEVLGRLATWPDDAEPARAEALVEAALGRWPAPSRGLTTIAARQLLADEVRPYVRLLGALDLGKLWQHRRHPALLARMVREGGLRRLHTLITRHDDGDALAAVIAADLEGLRILHLGGSHLRAGVHALAGCPGLAGLTTLALHNNQLRDPEAEALLASPHLHAVRSFNLYGNFLSAATCERLQAAPQWAGATFILHGQNQWYRG